MISLQLSTGNCYGASPAIWDHSITQKSATRRRSTHRCKKHFLCFFFI